MDGGNGAGGSGVGGSGAGGSGVGGSGAGGSGVGGSGAGGSGVGGNPAPPFQTDVALFNTDTEGFTFDGYHDLTATNLADATNPAVPPPALSFDATQGYPLPGSLQVTAPFSGANQYVEVFKLFGVSAPLDWTGKTLHVRLKVSQGTFNGYIQVYVSTSSIYAFGGTATQVGTGSAWRDYSLDVSNAMTRIVGYNPAQVVLVGVQLNTGGAGATPVVFNIDTFNLTP
jgi:hypothetical protein